MSRGPCPFCNSWELTGTPGGPVSCCGCGSQLKTVRPVRIVQTALGLAIEYELLCEAVPNRQNRELRGELATRYRDRDKRRDG